MKNKLIKKFQEFVRMYLFRRACTPFSWTFVGNPAGYVNFPFQILIGTGSTFNQQKWGRNRILFFLLKSHFQTFENSHLFIHLKMEIRLKKFVEFGVHPHDEFLLATNRNPPELRQNMLAVRLSEQDVPVPKNAVQPCVLAAPQITPLFSLPFVLLKRWPKWLPRSKI